MPLCVGWNTTVKVQEESPARVDPQVPPVMAKSPLVEAEIPVTDCEPLFFRVNVLAALVPPTAVLGKLALAGVKVTPAVPVPVSETACGLFGALSVMVTAPVRVPVCVGVKVTLNLQLAFAANVLEQVFELMAKSPLAAMLVIFSSALPLLVMVTDLPADVFPTIVLAKVSDAGWRRTPGALPVVMVS